MMARLASYIFVILFLWLVPAAANVAAQDTPDTVSSLPGIEITTSVDRAEILIGDRITYSVVITYDSTYELIPPPLGANLGSFEVKDYRADLIKRLPDGRRQSTSEYVLSTFTTGDYVIPPLPTVFELPDGTRRVVVSEGVPIRVKSLLDEAGADSIDIKPLKPVFEFERDYVKYYIWGGLALLFLALLGFILWWRFARRDEVEDVIDTRPPWEIAFERIAMLKEKRLPAEGRWREYYFELTEATRDFLGRMYERDVLEMTTDEFLGEFSKLHLPGSLLDRCRGLFTHADLVKFAKHEPDLERADGDLGEAHNIVELVRSDFARRMTPIDQAATTSEPREPEVSP